MNREPITDTVKVFELHALNVAARASEPLTNSQERAIDLHKRGFNVFPIPYGKKEPFEGTSLKRLYNSPAHLCGDGVEPCRHGASVPTFASLFYGLKNIAVMCGKTSGNLLAVDCDTHAAYELIGKELDALGVSYWAFTSHNGRGGYLLRVIEGETVNVAHSKFNKDVQLWGNSHYVILPLSTHPSGEVYRWRGDGDPRFQFATSYQTLPAVGVTVLDWLGVTLLKDDKPQAKPFETFGLSAEYFVLSERNREALAHGANDGERNARLTALAYDLAGCDLDRDEIESDFLRSAKLCKPAYKKRDALAILKSAYAKQRTRARKDNNTGEPTARIQRLYSFVNSFDWRLHFGRKASTRKLVFGTCVKRAEIEGMTFRASIRELAEMANRKYQFIYLCLHDLLDHDILRLVTPSGKSASGGNVYAFGVTVTHSEYFTVINTCNTNVNYSLCQKRPNTDAEKDVFGRLGGAAWHVWQYLQTTKARSKNAIAKATGLPQTSTAAAVKRLVTHGLAIHSEAEGLYYAEPVTDKELLTLSVKLKRNGRAELQRIGHGIDREIFINRNLSKAMKPFNDVTGERR